MSLNPVAFNNIFYAPYDYIILESNRANYFKKLKEKIKCINNLIKYLKRVLKNPGLNDFARYEIFTYKLNKDKQSLKAFESQGSYLSAA